VAIINQNAPISIYVESVSGAFNITPVITDRTISGVIHKIYSMETNDTNSV
jgi:hypothetical protein